MAVIYCLLVSAGIASCKKIHNLSHNTRDYPLIKHLEGEWLITSYKLDNFYTGAEYIDTLDLLTGGCSGTLTINFSAASKKPGNANTFLIHNGDCLVLVGTYILHKNGVTEIKPIQSDSLLRLNPTLRIFDHAIWSQFIYFHKQQMTIMSRINKQEQYITFTRL